MTPTNTPTATPEPVRLAPPNASGNASPLFLVTVGIVSIAVIALGVIVKRGDDDEYELPVDIDDEPKRTPEARSDELNERANAAMAYYQWLIYARYWVKVLRSCANDSNVATKRAMVDFAPALRDGFNTPSMTPDDWDIVSRALQGAEPPIIETKTGRGGGTREIDRCATMKRLQPRNSKPGDIPFPTDPPRLRRSLPLLRVAVENAENVKTAERGKKCQNEHRTDEN